MTENGITGTTSPINERSNIKHMSQGPTMTGGRTESGEPAGRRETPPGASRVATVQPRPGTGTPGAAGAESTDQVTVRMPADGAYLSVLRTATAGLAARLDFTLDEIEDMRIAVDEACAMLLSQAIPGSDLECVFTLGQDEMTVSVSVRCLAPRVPSGDTFAWTVLSALAGSVNAQVGPGDVLTIVLRKSRDSSRSV
jgi:serine/threonine-protein kinase RsbW